MVRRSPSAPKCAGSGFFCFLFPESPTASKSFFLCGVFPCRFLVLLSLGRCLESSINSPKWIANSAKFQTESMSSRTINTNTSLAQLVSRHVGKWEPDQRKYLHMQAKSTVSLLIACAVSKHMHSVSNCLGGRGAGSPKSRKRATAVSPILRNGIPAPHKQCPSVRAAEVGVI